MKKTILIFLLCILTVICFSGCQPAGEVPPDNTDQPIDDERLLDNDSDPVKTCMKYLWYGLDDDTEWISPAYNFEHSLDMVRDGKQMLLIRSISENCYYVCGYYDSETESNTDYENAKDYVWLRFESCSEIPERYGDRKLIVAFQFNSLDVEKDMISDDASIPSIECCFVYKTAFENGFNVNPKRNLRSYPQICIDLSGEWDKPLIGDAYFGSAYTLEPFEMIEGEYYIIRFWDECYDGKYYLGEEEAKEYFGRYYDALIAAKEPENYIVEMSEGYMGFILIRVDKFVEAIKSVWESEVQ